jgi:hypothetical protein
MVAATMALPDGDPTMLLIAPLLAATLAGAPAADWRTDAEISAYARTPRYEQTLAWLQRLDAASDAIELRDFGTSPEGRKLPLVIASADRSFTPALARERGKRVLLVQAGIHAGEIEGKDAGMALLRDLTVAGKHRGLLDDTVLLFIPIFSVDGHERFGPYNRINQNGPAEMGWRGTAQRINLNRDYVKADAPEMRAWLALWNAWRPDLLVDVHTTDGADYAYDLTWFIDQWDNQHPAIRAWQKDAILGRVFAATAKRRHRLAPYVNLVDQADPTKGIANGFGGPRFSTGYAAVRHRPALLVETHMLKDYATRVRASYDILLEILRELDRHPAALAKAIAAADADTVARGAAEVVLALDTPKTSVPFRYETYAWTVEQSDVSGLPWIRYDPKRPKTIEVPFYRELVPSVRVRAPAAYAIPPAWTAAIERVRLHGLRHVVLEKSMTVAAEAYRLTAPTWAATPFEGRVGVTGYELAREPRQAALPAGTVIVPLDQPDADLAMTMFEPDAPDSLLRWGFFNLIFERREYADERVAEQVARDLLARNPALQAEFQERLKDPAFAANGHARLQWFVDRSAWNEWDVGLYPILRLDAAAVGAAMAAIRGSESRP